MPMPSDTKAIQIQLKPANPLDVEPGELVDLAEEIRKLDLGSEVEIPPPEYMKGAGVTWWEVVQIYVPWHDVQTAAVSIALTKIGDAATSWMRQRFKRKPDRPKVVTIYSSKGKVLRTIALKTPNGEPKDEVT